MNESTLSSLRERFSRALEGAGAERPGLELFAELVARYGEPHRYYHDLGHVEACLTWLDWFAAHAESPAEVELALWFHDAVYDPGRGDNETRSAALASEHLRALGVPSESAERVAKLVLATQRHEARGGDASLVVDLDLTILGAEPAVYADFERKIRAEYAFVPAPAFRAARRSVLSRFLERERLFQTAAFHERLERRARENLAARITELAAAG